MSSPETIEQELRPAVCEYRQTSKNCDLQFVNTDRQTDLRIIIIDEDLIKAYYYYYIMIIGVLKTELNIILCHMTSNNDNNQ